jgi:transcriptional regulator with AAA-type ATPase domain
MMSFPNLLTWLKERTALSLLSEEVLAAIAPLLKQRRVAAKETIVRANTTPDGLYILNSGCAESYFSSLLPGTVINLEPLLLNQLVPKTIVTLCNCEVWWLSKTDFNCLVAEYPEINQAFSQQLITEITELSKQLIFNQERSLILRPYSVTKAKRGIIGKSRYANRLRQQIKEVAKTRESVLIFGEPGLEKDNIAALIHFGSPLRRETIIKINCNTIQASGAELLVEQEVNRD